MHARSLQSADEEIRKFQLLKYKQEYHYYLSAFKAIAANRQTPEAVLRGARASDLLTTDIRPAPRVIMVGDRVDKDMAPVWRLLGHNAMLIRLKAGKYKRTPGAQAIPRTNYAECSEFPERLLSVGCSAFL